MNIHSPMVLTSAFYTPDETNGVEGFIPIPIFSISQTCSNYQSQFVLTKQGKVFFQGLDYCGMLNDEKKMNFDFWVLVPFSFPIKQIQCGLEIVFLLTYQGQVYTSKYYKKNDSHYQYGIFPLSVPPIIQLFRGFGRFHIMLTENNELCLFGEMGIQNEPPPLISYFVDKPKIVQVAVSVGHVVVLLENGKIYTFGFESLCGIKLSTIQDVFPPQLLSENFLAKRILCSNGCTIFETMDGKWYGYGDHANQYYPQYSKKMTVLPTRIDEEFPKGIKIKKFEATQTTFFILTTTKKLYARGSNLYKETGRNKQHQSWTLIAKGVMDIQAGITNLFLFYPSIWFSCVPKVYTDIWFQFKWEK